MQFQDRTLKCIDCGGEFIFTAGEQLFFHDKQFRNEPKRCKPCKAKRLATIGAPQRQGQTAPSQKFCDLFSSGVLLEKTGDSR